MLNPVDNYLRINEIKNYLYCPRIPFYTLCLEMDRETALSQLGIESESIAKKKMKRRKHALHAVHDGSRHFDVPVILDDYALIGRIDEVVETDAGCYIVDYKDTDRDYGYWKIQLYAYRLGIEAQGKMVLGCYIYTIPNQSYIEMKITQREAKKLDEIVQALRSVIETQICPDPTPHDRKCHTCQYACFCNDVT